MRWPWMSRAAHEAILAAERNTWTTIASQHQALIDRLQDHVDKLIEHRMRVERVQSGMPEQPREKKTLEAMPEPLMKYFDGFSSRSIRIEQKRTAYRRHANGESWDSIIADVVGPEEPPEIEDLQDAAAD